MKTRPRPIPSRLLAFAVFGGLSLSLPLIEPVAAAAVDYTLYMTEKDKTITIPLYTSTYTRTFWIEGFTTRSGDVPDVGGVTLTAQEGDTVTITVFNQTGENHEFLIEGTAVPKLIIPASQSKTVTFTAPAAGNYIYHDPTIDLSTSKLNRAAGMAGVLVVYPVGQVAGESGNFWNGGPRYDADFTWVLSDFDKTWNASERGNTPITKPYVATYAFINGDFGTHSMHNAKTSPVPTVGQHIAIRLVNVGMIPHPVHFHGYHGSVFRVNNVQQGRIVEKDVIDVPPMTTMDVLFHIDMKGLYIVHDHTGMMVTQDGIYAEGMIAMFDVCKKYGPLIPGDPFCPTHTIGVPGGWGGWGGR